jgi:hypothetical protein
LKFNINCAVITPESKIKKTTINLKIRFRRQFIPNGEMPTTRRNQLDKNLNFKNKKRIMAKKWERNEKQEKEVEWSEDKKRMNRRDQVAIITLKTAIRHTRKHGMPFL